MQQETTARRRARTSGIMRSAQRAFLLLGAIVFFGLGIAAGLSAREWWSDSPPVVNVVHTPTPANPQSSVPTSAPIQQISFLILLVDSLDRSQPTLEGVWLVTFDRGSSSYFFMGFDRNQIVSEDRRLVDVYAYEAAGDLNTRRDLTAYAIRKLNGGQPIQFTVMFDRALLGEVIDAVGGISLNGEVLDGSTFLARHGSLTSEAETLSIDLQHDVAQALFAALKTRAWQAMDIETFYNAHQNRYALPPELLIYALEALPFDENEFIVQLNPQ